MSDMKQVSLKVWILGFVWAVVAGMAPVGILIWDWTSRWNTPLDTTMIWHQAATCAVLGAGAYWRKNKALFQLPPDFEAARELAQEVKTVTTVETVQHQQHPPVTVTTTIEKTEIAQEPKA